METSQLRMYSLGIVVADKVGDVDQIMVMPIEPFYMQEDGYVKDWGESHVGGLKDILSEGFQSELTARAYIVADWLRLGDSNRATAPNVKAGETIVLYKFSDVNEYYWQDIKVEPHLRRLENVVYRYNNLSGDPGEEVTDDTSYWVRVSTRDKILHIHTANNDGEPYSYDITLNTGEGLLNITDNDGNDITLDSANDTLTTHLDKDFVLITENDTNVHAKNNINLEADSDVNVTAHGNINATSDGDTTVETGGNLSATVNGDMSAKVTGAISIEGNNNMTIKTMGGVTVKDMLNISLKVAGSTFMVGPEGITMLGPIVTINGVMIDQGGNIIGAASYVGGPVLAPNNLM